MRTRNCMYLSFLPSSYVCVCWGFARMVLFAVSLVKCSNFFIFIPLAIDADTDMARVYDLEIDTQYVPLSIYSLAVDYPDVGVQVTNI